MNKLYLIPLFFCLTLQQEHLRSFLSIIKEDISIDNDLINGQAYNEADDPLKLFFNGLFFAFGTTPTDIQNCFNSSQAQAWINLWSGPIEGLVDDFYLGIFQEFKTDYLLNYQDFALVNDTLSCVEDSNDYKQLISKTGIDVLYNATFANYMIANISLLNGPVQSVKLLMAAQQYYTAGLTLGGLLKTSTYLISFLSKETLLVQSAVSYMLSIYWEKSSWALENCFEGTTLSKQIMTFLYDFSEQSYLSNYDPEQIISFLKDKGQIYYINLEEALTCLQFDATFKDFESRLNISGEFFDANFNKNFLEFVNISRSYGSSTFREAMDTLNKTLTSNTKGWELGEFFSQLAYGYAQWQAGLEAFNSRPKLTLDQNGLNEIIEGVFDHFNLSSASIEACFDSNSAQILANYAIDSFELLLNVINGVSQYQWYYLLKDQDLQFESIKDKIDCAQNSQSFQDLQQAIHQSQGIFDLINNYTYTYGQEMEIYLKTTIPSLVNNNTQSVSINIAQILSGIQKNFTESKADINRALRLMNGMYEFFNLPEPSGLRSCLEQNAVHADEMVQMFIDWDQAVGSSQDDARTATINFFTGPGKEALGYVKALGQCESSKFNLAQLAKIFFHPITGENFQNAFLNTASNPLFNQHLQEVGSGLQNYNEYGAGYSLARLLLLAGTEQN